jgi:hypothetical protein
MLYEVTCRRLHNDIEQTVLAGGDLGFSGAFKLFASCFIALQLLLSTIRFVCQTWRETLWEDSLVEVVSPTDARHPTCNLWPP